MKTKKNNPQTVEIAALLFGTKVGAKQWNSIRLCPENDIKKLVLPLLLS